jgi:hypothetical protein
MYKWRYKIRYDGSQSIMLTKHSDTYSSGSQTSQLKGQFRSIYPGLAPHSPLSDHESQLPCKSSQIFWMSSSCEKDPRIVPNKTTGHKIADFPALMAYRLLPVGFVWWTDFRLSIIWWWTNDQYCRKNNNSWSARRKVERTFEISYIGGMRSVVRVRTGSTASPP